MSLNVMKKEFVHPTAIIDPQAKLAANCQVGPFSVIGPDVNIAEDVVIGQNCLITGRTSIGKGCQIYTGAVVGSSPQDLKHKASDAVSLEIGEYNTIREYVTMNPGTLDGGGKTVIGHKNLIMAYAHVAHDCQIANHCVLANAATLAGHVTLEDHVVIGGLSAVHQFVRLGKLAIIGGCSKVVQDVAPYAMCDGHPVRVVRTNSVGLKRVRMDVKTIQVLNKAFKILFRSKSSRKTAIQRIKDELPPSPELTHLITFCETSKRGLCS